MLDAFIITLREAAELLLICATLRAYLLSEKRHDLLPWCTAGAVSGMMAGFVLAALIAQMKGSAAVQATLTIILASAALFMTTGMLSSVNRINRQVDWVVAAWSQSPSAPWVVFGFAAFAGVRESLESALFLRSIQLLEGTEPVLTGVVAALALVALLCAPWVWIRAKVSVMAAFRVSAVLLSLLAIDLLLEGVGQLLREIAPHGNNAALLQLAQPFLQDGRWHGWLVVSLFCIPLSQFIRSWWNGSERREPG